jgi:hypothetical protein
MSFKISWKENNSYFQFENTIDINELIKASDLLLGDKRFELMNYAIFDFLEIKTISISEKEVKLISLINKTSARWNRYLKIACLTNDDNVVQKLNLYQDLMKNTNWKVEIFSHEKDAIKWCQIN